MTYRQYIENLRNDFAIKTDLYLKAEKELVDQGNGFIDKRAIEKFTKAKIEWQNIANAHSTFFDFMRDSDINPDDEMY